MDRKKIKKNKSVGEDKIMYREKEHQKKKRGRWLPFYWTSPAIAWRKQVNDGLTEHEKGWVLVI